MRFSKNSAIFVVHDAPVRFIRSLISKYRIMATLYEKLKADQRPSKWKKIVAEGLDVDYCERFLTAAEGTALMEYMEHNVRYLDGRLTQVKVFGRFYQIPRQQVAFGDDGVSYKFSGTVVPAQSWPRPLLDLKNKILLARGVDYNFVLVNRYGGE